MTATRKRPTGKARWLGGAAALAIVSASGFAMQHAPDGAAAAANGGAVLQFDSGSAQLSAANRSALQPHLQYLRVHPDMAVVIEGHTHEHGPLAQDLKLGLERALAVSEVLEQGGIDRDRIRLVSYGDDPASAEAGPARRVALRYVPAAQDDALGAERLAVTSPLLGIPLQD